MKTTSWMLGAIVAGMLALCGCSKSASTDPKLSQNPAVRFTAAFPTPTPELQASINKINLGLRYGQYPEAIVELDKMANDASLTEAQKKAVNDMIEEVKKRAAGPAAGAAPAPK